MIRKTLTILSLIGLLLSVGLWGVSYWNFKYHLDESRHFLLYLQKGTMGLSHSPEIPVWPQEWLEERDRKYVAHLQKKGSELDPLIDRLRDAEPDRWERIIAEFANRSSNRR